MHSLASRIREAFGSAKPAEIARATNKSRSAVTQWLDGSVESLKAETAAMMEAVTGYRAGWIISGKGPKKVAETFGAPTEQEMQLLRDLRSLAEDDRREVVEEIHMRAEKMRAHIAKILRGLGIRDPVSDDHVELHLPPLPPGAAEEAARSAARGKKLLKVHPPVNSSQQKRKG